MRKINGVSASMISVADLNSVIEKGRGRDAHKARMELARREQFKASVVVIRGPLDIDCPHCGAKAGEACVTSTGNTAKATHSARIKAVS